MDTYRFLKQLYLDMITSELRYMSDAPATPNITYNSLLYLDLIAGSEHCTVSLLARRLDVAKSAVTLKVNELVKQGFVVRTQSPDDKRVWYLSVTGKVTEEYLWYNGQLSKSVAELESSYSPQDIRLFCEMLERVSSHFA